MAMTETRTRGSGGAPTGPSYLLADQASELGRLRLQSRVWEPAGEMLLREMQLPADAVVLDVGCGAMGWLRALRRRLGDGGRVVGSDVDPRMLAAARAFVVDEKLAGVEIVEDDLFASRLPAAGFDLVHARFQLAPLGRDAEQLHSYCARLKPGGWLVLEDPDAASWRIHPQGPATEELIMLLQQAFTAAGGHFNAGRELPRLMRQHGIEPALRAQVVALEPGHPYLRLPLQFAAALKGRLEALVGAARLTALLDAAEWELQRPGVWGTSFTLVQAFGRKH
ncbi:MAG: methyltransferase domain-containing protein [Piscinibacter sp.]